jgi:hypothetical protein
MDKKTKELAEQAGFVLDELPDTVLQPLKHLLNYCEWLTLAK